jgi:hypothetical protein
MSDNVAFIQIDNGNPIDVAQTLDGVDEPATGLLGEID